MINLDGKLARALLASALTHLAILASTVGPPGSPATADATRLFVVVSAARPPAAPATGGRQGATTATTQAVPPSPAEGGALRSEPSGRELVAAEGDGAPAGRTPVATAPSPVAIAPGDARAALAAAPPLEAVPGAAPARSDAVTAAPESEDLRAFRIAIAAAAAGFREYPPMARERGWQGVVGVRVSYLPGREAPDVALAKSSGVPTLDQSALRMMRRAAETVAMPGSLRGRALRLEMPVDYRLED